MTVTYDKLIITNLPAFYKIRLFNEISRHQSLMVIYTGHQPNGRNKDFFNEESLFQSITLDGNNYKKCLTLTKIIHKLKYKELIIGSWDHLPMWAALIYSKKAKNSLIVESSIYESSTNGIKGLLKKLFCSRINKVYVSGCAQKQLLENLNFKGRIKITHGVGIFNYLEQPQYFEKREPIKKYLYVGRLTAVKNLEFLIEVFNNLPDLELNIVGFGELEQKLKTLANDNIIFHGAIDNKDLPDKYKQMDVLVLPSISEPWGLVVEEALNNGLPVIASDRVGCKDDLVTDNYGIVFNHQDKSSLIEAINKMRDLNFYNSLRYNISNLNFEDIEKTQVEAYLN